MLNGNRYLSAMLATFITLWPLTSSGFSFGYVLSPWSEGSGVDDFLVRVETEIGSDFDVVEYPVTDIRVNITPFEGEAGDLMAAENLAGRHDVYAWEFSVQFHIAAGGKLFLDGSGVCSLWENDVAYCGVEDDGGTFNIKRHWNDDSYDLEFIFGVLPDRYDDKTYTDILLSWDDFYGEMITLDLAIGTEASIMFDSVKRR